MVFLSFGILNIALSSQALVQHTPKDWQIRQYGAGDLQHQLGCGLPGQGEGEAEHRPGGGQPDPLASRKPGQQPDQQGALAQGPHGAAEGTHPHSEGGGITEGQEGILQHPRQSGPLGAGGGDDGHSAGTGGGEGRHLTPGRGQGGGGTEGDQ